MKIIWAVFLAWFLAQLYKILSYYHKSGDWRWILLFENGGMPSSHTSSVTALSLAVYLEQGASLLLMACVVFSLIVINDSLNVRRQTGLQAGIIEELLGERINKPKLSKTVGHRPREVIAGLILGLLTTGIVYAYW